MILAHRTFIDNISSIRVLSNIGLPVAELLNDVLRFQLVYAVSAFDRFMHEIIRII